MHNRKLMSALFVCVLIPAISFLCFSLLEGRQYYLLSAIIVVCSMLPFFYSLERKKLQARELVIIASVIAIAVISRAAFFYLPQVKPMCALLIISAISFGAQFGFVTGALSMLLSNFIFGQGMWTPFQMLGMGTTVFLCTMIIKLFKIKNRIVMGLVSTVLCFVVYGFFGNISFVLMSSADFKSVLTIFMSGAPFDLVHAVTTGLLVTVFAKDLGERLERIKIKYGLFGERE